MSGGYADRLTFRGAEALGGKLGEREYEDEDVSVNAAVDELGKVIAESRGVAVYTGAGISTSCGIPDFRGPNGIWTLQAQGLPLPKTEMTLELASPSLTHMALAELVKRGVIKLIVSQNVDDLHRRSGVPEDKLAELHGNCFLEKCHRCKATYRRDFEMLTAGFKFTGRRCTKRGCRGKLKDFVLDWDDALPEDDLAKAEEYARSKTDVALCLGTSLRIAPACQIPVLTKKCGGKLVIVNLQKTPKDKHSDLKIHAKCDRVMARLMDVLGMEIPPYTRYSELVVEHTSNAKHVVRSKKQKQNNTVFGVRTTSVHSEGCPIPFLDGSASQTLYSPSGKVLEPLVGKVGGWSYFDCEERGAYRCEFAFPLKPQLNAPKNPVTHEYRFQIEDGTEEGRETVPLITGIRRFDQDRPERRENKKAKI
ncbi:Sir2-like protein [Chloropicon primus]|uniref:protein acetyllysine N-acetyltransferase n=2 Tax=Chloropicon primus TaxID=1764295 RepID=A0A5B8MWD9_9CHLO|nr:Sir2-like protein [Chloropicon primus]|eukprot:QDZ23770.1 Sir2-like protein [Chloropicon primus]